MKLSNAIIALSSVLLFSKSEASPGLRTANRIRPAEEVDMPQVGVPDNSLPEVDMPQIDVPDNSLPEVDRPEVEVPDNSLPEVDRPEIDVPDNSLPSEDDPSLPIESQCVPPSKNDKCSTDDSYDDCLFYENIGCTQILATSSCPPLFYCGHSIDGPTLPIESPCIPPQWNGDECHSQKSYKECLSLLGQGCPDDSIGATSSCPPQYFCTTPESTPPPTVPPPTVAPTTPKPTDPPTEEPTTPEPTPEPTEKPTTEAPTPEPTTPAPTTPRPTDPPKIGQPIETKCTLPDGECQTDESYLECAVLEAQKCEKIIATMSCPPQYRCGDSQCVSPSTDSCQSAESYNQCIGLEEMGCDEVIHTMSCPPTYTCASWGKRSQCALPDNCQTEESYLECKRLEAAGCQSILSSTEECPPQHRCSHYWPNVSDNANIAS